MGNIEEIRKLLKEKKLIIGTNEVIKGLKLGRLSRIYLSKNVPSEVEGDIKHYASVSGIEIVKLNQSNDTLGTLCKKPFSISVLGVIKG